METYLDKLVLSHPLRDPVIRQAIRALELPTGSRGLDWFREAGFAEPTARTVVGTLQAPLDHGIRRALISLFGMLWGEMQTKMVRADREEYQRLADPESPDFILDSADYYAFFTYSMFEGRVARDERMMTERDPDPCQAETDS